MALRRVIRRTVVVAWVVAVGFCCGVGLAQDTRIVTEPKIPPVCVRLEARLYAAQDANGGKIREEDEAKLDTERIQKALDGCGAGKAVELAIGSTCKGAAGACGIAGNAFLSGPLDMREGVTLVVDKNVTVYGSRDPKVFEIHLPGEKSDAVGLCGTRVPRPTNFPVQLPADAPARRGGCRSLININGAKNVGLMGEGTLDGRGYAKILGKDYSWWEMARKSEPKDDLYYTPRLIVASHADGLVLYKISLHNSGNFHVAVNQTDGFTAWGMHLNTPVNKKLDARNTDGIDPGTSQNITIAHSWIDNGDDNIAIKQGVSHMSVIDNHFYTGHGMSIGSETVLGQSYLLVEGLTEDHTTSGIRIKSNVKRGGPVHDLVYKNICMRDVPIPIAISPYYTNQTVEPFADPKYEGDKVPDYKNIKLENVYSTTPGDVLIAGLNDQHRTVIDMQDVFIKGIQPSQIHLFYADFMVHGTGANFQLKGESVRVMAVMHTAPMPPADPCEGKFVPMQ